MARITNQDEFIKKANEIHNGKYNYSKVKYIKSSEKVIIICPEHGSFEKTPNKHLRGQGCPVCGRNRTKIGIDEFMQRAIKVHGNRYDYSKVVYQRKDVPVEIICSVHGSFMQTPHCHVVLKQNCPKCAAIAGGLKRTGENNVSHRKDVKQKKAQTCVERYGATTWAASDEGRQRMHDIIVNEKLDIMKATCQERYGTDFWTQSDEGRSMLRELMSSDEMQEKVAEGYKKVYGMHYMQTEAGREKARRSSALRVEGLMRKYNVASPMKLGRVVQKSWATKRRNGTFNTSKPEQTLYGLLCDVFGVDNVVCQYIDEERYPFHCDFYVKSLDLFIELNAHWSHGGHWFDENDEADLERLSFWLDKAKEKGSRYYHAAIYIWTERDLLKRTTAEKNNLNYVVFWASDLSDAREYLLTL